MLQNGLHLGRYLNGHVKALSQPWGAHGEGETQEFSCAAGAACEPDALRAWHYNPLELDVYIKTYGRIKCTGMSQPAEPRTSRTLVLPKAHPSVWLEAEKATFYGQSSGSLGPGRAGGCCCQTPAEGAGEKC